MKRIFPLILTAASVVCLADVQYEETARVTGGSLTRMPIVGGRMKEPITTTHTLKGNKLSVSSKSEHMSSQTIYDLDKETVTTVNHEKKQYSVMTFEEMRQAMEKMMEQMRSVNPETANAPKGEMEFSVDVKDGNEDKDVQGLAAHKWIVTVDMTAKDAKTGRTGGSRMYSEIWASKDFPGGEELLAFQKRMAEKMGFGMLSSMNPMARAQMGKGYEKYAQELSKMSGHPVMTMFRMSALNDGKEAMISESQANAPAGDVKGAVKDAATEDATNAATSAASSRLGGRLGGLASGGLGGFRRKKKEEQPPPPAPEATASASGEKMVPASMMEMTTELSSVSKSEVDAGQLAVPGDYKQVESDMKRYLKK